MKEYGITYNSLIYEFAKSADDVKYRLLQLGLATKSLEGVSIFADSFTVPSDETIIAYLKRKEQLARDIIGFLRGGIDCATEAPHRLRAVNPAVAQGQVGAL